MAWITPKTNWNSADGVRNTDLNRIEGNILDLRGKFLHSTTTITVSTSGNDSTGNGTSSAPFRTIAKALSTLPKNMSGSGCTIHVMAGSYTELVQLWDYTGGTVTLSGPANANVSINGLDIRNSNVLVSGINLNVGTSGIYVGSAGMLYCASGSIVVSGAAEGVTLRYGAVLEITTTLTINNATRALQVQYASTASVATLAGSGNTIGIYAYNSSVYVSTLQLTATSRIINENSAILTRGVS